LNKEGTPAKAALDGAASNAMAPVESGIHGLFGTEDSFHNRLRERGRILLVHVDCHDMLARPK